MGEKAMMGRARLQAIDARYRKDDKLKIISLCSNLFLVESDLNFHLQLQQLRELMNKAEANAKVRYCKYERTRAENNPKKVD
jgi:hypothetical protein